MLSRNFRLQKIGDFEWLNKHYNFSKIAFSIDELIILNVSRGDKKNIEFSSTIQNIIGSVFIPVSIGGGISNIDDAKLLMDSGADKLVLNSALYNDRYFVEYLIKVYGSQCIVASIDFKEKNGELIVFIENGTKQISMCLSNYIDYVEDIGVGEIYLNSIDKDGTGQGYNLKALDDILNKLNIPVIMSGGAGNFKHFASALEYETVDAVATANLLNFIGDGLPSSRKSLLENGYNFAKWKESVFLYQN